MGLNRGVIYFPSQNPFLIYWNTFRCYVLLIPFFYLDDISAFEISFEELILLTTILKFASPGDVVIFLTFDNTPHI